MSSMSHYIVLAIGCMCIGYTIKPTVKDVILAIVGMLLVVIAYNFL